MTIEHPSVNTKFATKLPERIILMMHEETVPWGPIGYVTYKRTYSRQMDCGRKEEYADTIARCLNGLLHIGGAFTLRELEVLAGYLMQLKCNFSGRSLWQLGTPTVDRLGGDSLQACWHVRMNEPVDPFCFAFEELMLGGGVGFSIMPEDVYEIPPVKYNVNINRVNTFDCDYIVPDNREGWVGLLRKILEAFFFTGKNVNYNPDCLRAKGEPIKSFGGIASGSIELVNGLNEIVKILKSRHGMKLRPIDVMDIVNIIGKIVVSGNVRRSAELAKGSGRDRDFLLAKYWGNGNIIPPWRQMSNNTVAESNLKELLPEFWWGYEDDSNGIAQGEPYGLYNPYLVENYRRLIDPIDLGYNSKAVGPNPCGEENLENYEGCNVGDIYLTNLVDGNQFHTVGELMIKVLKTISILPFLYDRTNDVVRRNHRLGLGVTGVMAARHLHRHFDSVYRHVKETDKEYSKVLGVSPSIALTTVKPSGTIAKFSKGCTPGANPGYSQYCKVLITFASNSPMLSVLKEKGYPMEPKINLDGSYDYGSTMVGFPVSYPDGTPTEEISALQQLENVVNLQRYWSDNAVSATIQFDQYEVPAIKAWMYENYSTSLKTIAFCRHTGHNFKQPPNTPLSREEFNSFRNSVEPIVDGDFLHCDNDNDLMDGECPGGQCGIR
jgi:ribonucleoside-triphosphate reductase